MKKIVNVVLIVSALLIGFSFAACDTGTGGGGEGGGGNEGNPLFPRIWKASNKELNLSSASAYSMKAGGVAYNSGTYSATASEITFTVTSGTHSGTTARVGYTVNNTTLTLTYITGQGFDGLGIAGTYTKQ
jgi:hypothetical protein